MILLSYLAHILVFIGHTQRPFKTTYETQSAQVYKMTSQTPSSLGTNVIKGQDDASIRTNDVVITPEMTPDVINMLLKRFKFDVIPEKVSPKKAPDNSGNFAAVAKLLRKLRALERFPDQSPCQSATPEQRKAGLYLAEQREACKQMLLTEMTERW
ncbi:hypothetical protein DER45DRAFT_543396 [Fusarium avenaceum]|nr:hypothetical protein DER45DRAFT_543396 [Fusarium avenaceum]